MTATLIRMNAEQIVTRLLENEIDPKQLALRSTAQPGALDDDVLRDFKSSAIQYIKWITSGDIDPGVIEDVNNCTTFQSVAQILSLYDEAGEGIGFLEMREQGYFL